MEKAGGGLSTSLVGGGGLELEPSDTAHDRSLFLQNRQTARTFWMLAFAVRPWTINDLIP